MEKYKEKIGKVLQSCYVHDMILSGNNQTCSKIKISN
jgi:hypothetical protein